MTAEDISKLVAPIVNFSYPQDKAKLFLLASMTNMEIWKQGKWHGMIKEFHVNIKHDGEGRPFITMPDDYNVLLGINLDSKPTRIRNHWFQFHRNSLGSVSKEQGWNMTGAAMDMGDSPVIEQPRRRNEIELCAYDPVYLAVRSRGGCDDGKIVTISGENRLGEKNFSYNTKYQDATRTMSQTELVKVDSSPTYGVEYKLTNKFTLFENVHWSHITEIRKEVTNSPVDVYAVYESGESHLVATLQPHQTRSRYRNYLLPQEECRDWKCVHILAKASEPEMIQFGSQPMITANITALMDMMIGNDYKYFKKDLNAAAAYIMSSVTALEQSTKENMSNHESPIQVDEGITEIPSQHLQ